MRDMVSKRTTRRDMRREATKAAVLEAAHQVFLTHGYERATIKTIADEAAVSPGTVLNAEPTKAALLVAILHGECEQIAEGAEQLEGALTGAASDRLAALLQLLLDGHLKHAELFAAALAHRWLDASADFQMAFDALAFIWEPVRRVLDDGTSKGEFRSDLQVSVAMHAIREVFYSALREALSSNGADPRAALSNRMNVVIGGLKA